MVSAKQIGTLQQTQQIRCIVEHSVTELGPLKRKQCKSEHIQNWTLQADTYKHSILVSTNTESGPIQTDTEKTWKNSEHTGVETPRQTQ